MPRTSFQNPVVPAAVSEASPTQASQVLFPFYYLGLIFVSALDLIFTYTILMLGGYEVNPIANAVLQSPAQFNGLIIFKFIIVVAVIGICEFIGRYETHTARRLSTWAIAISAFPVAWSLLLLASYF